MTIITDFRIVGVVELKDQSFLTSKCHAVKLLCSTSCFVSPYIEQHKKVHYYIIMVFHKNIDFESRWVSKWLTVLSYIKKVKHVASLCAFWTPVVEYKWYWKCFIGFINSLLLLNWILLRLCIILWYDCKYFAHSLWYTM